MNIADILIFLIALACIWVAYGRGFILSALVLLSWIAVLAAALLLYKPAGALLLKLWPKTGRWSPALGFAVVIILAQAIFDRLMVWLLNRLPRRLSGSRLNHALGVFPGFINGFVWATLLSAFLIVYPLEGRLTRDARKSRIARSLAGNVGWLNKSISPVFSDALLQLRDTPAAMVSHERMIRLPFKVTNARPRPDLEAELLRLVNQERTRRRLQPLRADPELTEVARKHSDDMFSRGYFSHYTPEGSDPIDRMKKDGIHFLIGGENIAITQTLPMAHTGFMNSPGHRANILNPAFGRVGIGILEGGFYGLMITQSFGD